MHNNSKLLTARTSLLGIELHRIDTVVSILLVTSGEATAAGFALGKPDGNCPDPPRSLLADLCGLAADVRIVAGAAGEPPILPVNMQIVQVEPAVSKISLVVHVAFADDPFLMASEA